MQEGDFWTIVRRRLEDPVLALMRKARRLIDLPSFDVDDALAVELAGLKDEQLRQLWSIIVSAAFSQERRWLAYRQQPSGQPADEAAAATAWRRRGTSLAVGRRIKERLAQKGQSTEPVGVGSREKLEAWHATSKALGRLGKASAQAGWTAEAHAQAERLLTEMERLRSVEPRDYLARDIGWGIGTVQEGIADQLNGAGSLTEAKRRYLAAAESFKASGYVGDARRCGLSLVAMVRRIAAGFDETIAELSKLLDEAGDSKPYEVGASKPSVARAELRASLAQTYALVGDGWNAKAQLEFAANDVAACGYVAADAEVPERSLRAWIEHADAACPNPEEFEAELAGLITLHASSFDARGHIESEGEAIRGQMWAASAYGALGERLTQEMKKLLEEQSRERKAFVSEFGDRDDDRFEVLEADETRVDKQIAALQALNEDLDRLRPEIERREAAGAAMDELLPELDRIEAEARAFDLVVVQGVTLLWRADIHMAAGRFADAIASARAAFDLPRPAQLDLTTGLYALDRIISASIATRNDAAISATCGEAIELIERSRYNVSAPYSQSAYLQSRARYYTIGIDTAWRCDDLDTVLQRAELSKAAGSLRHVGQAPSDLTADELEAQSRWLYDAVRRASDAGQPEEASALRARRRVVWDLLSIARARAATIAEPPQISVEAVCKALEPDEAVVYYYWLVREVLLVVALNRDGVVMKKVKVPDKARRQIEEMAAYAQSVRESNSYLDAIPRRFSRLLLPDEIRKVLEGRSRLIFSPHHLLHALPLHALTWDGDVLIRRFAVSYAPNLGCLLRSFEPAAPKRVLAIAVQEFAVKGVPLHPIEEAESEVDAVAAAYERKGVPVTKLRTADAMADALRRLNASGELAGYSCLHLVTHGADVLGDTPLESQLFLRDGPVDGLEIAAWRLSAELVALSACHSGQRAISLQGAEIMSDEIFGLQAALFTAGAKRVLGALWPVESEVAAAIMPRFHADYAAGTAPEVALQKAIVEYLDRAGPRTSSLYYWAPFFLVAVARSRTSADKRAD